MLSLCVPVPICVRLFKENSIKRSQCLLIKKKNQYEKEINCIFGEKKKESNEMTLTEKRRIRNFKHSMIYKFLF